MSIIYELLRSTIRDSQSYLDVVSSVSRSVTSDVAPVIVEGLNRVEEIIIARAFTKYGWLLAIYEILGKVEDGRLIVYYNAENQRWTASILIHELAHAGLDLDRLEDMDVVIDESLAYTASYKSGFLDLYEEANRSIIETLSKCKNPYNEYELLYTIVPRIVARRLTSYDYGKLVGIVRKGKTHIFRLWLNANPSGKERLVMATLLNRLGIDPGFEIHEACSDLLTLDVQGKFALGHEGVDRGYVRMVEILKRAAKNRDRAYEILGEWWDQLRDLKPEIEAYLELHSSDD